MSTVEGFRFDGRRIREVVLSLEDFLVLLRHLDGKSAVWLQGLPPGAVPLAVTTWTENGYVALLFEHETFGPVRHGASIPRIAVRVRHDTAERVVLANMLADLKEDGPQAYLAGYRDAYREWEAG